MSTTRADIERTGSDGPTFLGHPRGLATLFFTEMWERFSYYGMRALLTLFMTSATVGTNPGLGLDVATAGAIYGLYTSLVYILALPGGWVADNLWGSRKAVWVGGWTIALGHFTMAIPTTFTFFLGMFFIICGTGLLKPNVSTMVGELYPEGGARRDAGFSIFYMGINLGAFVGPLITGVLGESMRWHWGFGAAGVGMVIGLIQYRLGVERLEGAGELRGTSTPEELAARSKTFFGTFFGIVAGIVAGWFGWLDPLNRSFSEREDTLGIFAIVALCLVAAWFREDHFVLLLMLTVMLYTVATLGLNIQFGYAGVLNFAGASFFGIGAYTSAVLNTTAVPHLLVLLIGGLLAALIGSLLLLPVLRTRGHYAALVTIAFALLLKTFLEVNDVLGGPQGMQVRAMKIFGWSFNDNVEIGGLSLSFYMNYFVVALLLLVAAFVLVRRLERSWIGLNFDALRLDETAAGCFGLNIARWKITSFTLGNFLIGIAGALFGMVGGFVAPNNYTFADSLILVSILLLGGIGNPWGIVVATIIVVVVPEKLQTIQEYRFLLYAVMVIGVLLFRPEGLLPRPVRRYFPGGRA